jgi:8-oxo-dGTP diphosphatase
MKPFTTMASIPTSANALDSSPPTQTSTKLVLVVAVAFLDTQGRVLLAERPAGKSMAGLWEFPGGKVESGETPEAALVRELQEELGVTVNIEKCFPLTFASHTYEKFHLLMPLYGCTDWKGEFSSKEGQRFEWVDAEKLPRVPMPAADVPLLPAVLQAMRTQAVAV